MALEFVGASFGLALNEDTLLIIEQGVAIYKRWLGLGSPEAAKVVVPCFGNSTQEFTQQMIKQLSGLFEKRPLTSMSTLPFDRTDNRSLLSTVQGGDSSLWPSQRREAAKHE